MKTPEERSRLQISFEPVMRKLFKVYQPRMIAEWGPGRSTEVMLECLDKVHILTIEHDPKWFREFETRPGQTVDFQHRVISMKGGHSTGYVTYPLTTGKLYDFIFVDGRFRRDCLIVASRCLQPYGVVILHDNHRENYWPAYKFYKYQINDTHNRTEILTNDFSVYRGYSDPA